ncbi:S-adenosyl-L-methionine-dependent methyltransferase [Pilatotrama ljubarskyi]|nr:S-adenosyl-L-methionine-dependent methyltransferase [Pilatotrama ljubarskyi]
MTFAALRSLYALIGDALDDIERVYQDASLDIPSAPATPYAVLTSPCTPYRPRHAHNDEEEDEDSYPPFPTTQAPKTPSRRQGQPSVDLHILDFPPLDVPYYPTEEHAPELDAAESLASHPDVIAATNRIVAACGQISATVHRPFLTLCDAAMGYHLPACLRFLEASHTVEILRTAGPNGMHVRDLSRHVNVDEGKLSHILRLLATHHITREVRPNVFANNRISAIMDSGRSPEELRRAPQDKYETTNGIAAFMNLCTDELFKSSAYLTDCYLPSLAKTDKEQENPMHAPFNLAFNTATPYFEWLEQPGNEVRLKRFGPAMTGTAAWEVPGAIVSAFAWQDLHEGALVVDVGGGIGSTAMLLAHTFPHLRFVIQDRPQVAEHGITAWRDRCPEMLDSGRAMFLGHDFFQPQPPLILPGSIAAVKPSVYVLRVITHDWPDVFVTKILLNLRLAAGADTKLLLADHVLPHACVDEDSDDDPAGRDPLPGAIRSLAPDGSPLLANLGKANANAYWMDLTMRATFNAQERTLREMATLTLTAGWKIVDVAHAEGSLFGHMTAVPVEIPAASLSLLDPVPEANGTPREGSAVRTRSGSVTSTSGTIRMGSTFGTLSSLPTEEAIRKPARRDRRPLIPWWRGRKDSQSAKSAKMTTPEGPTEAAKTQKGRPKLAIVTSPAPGLHHHSVYRSPALGTSSMVRISATDSDRTAVSSPETTPDSTKVGHETILLPAPDEPSLLPALEPAPPVKLRAMPSRTSLRKKASQVFEFSKASVASLRSAALGTTSTFVPSVPPVPPLPPMPPLLPVAAVPFPVGSSDAAPEIEIERGLQLGEEGSSGGGALKGLKKMRSRTQSGLARVTVEVRSGRTVQVDAGRAERPGSGGDA